MLIPRKKTPNLRVQMLNGNTFDLSTESTERGTLVCFYRGLHCPICANYLTELEQRVDEFAERGVNVIAVSSDEQERAQAMADKIKAGKLRFGYGLDLEKAKEWGLYISTSRGKNIHRYRRACPFFRAGTFFGHARTNLVLWINTDHAVCPPPFF